MTLPSTVRVRGAAGRPVPAARTRRAASMGLALVLLATTAACSSEDADSTRPLGVEALPPADAIVAASGSWAPAPTEADGMALVASASGSFALHTAGGDRTFLPGINLGSSIPGAFPGQVGEIGADQYRAWLEVAGRTGSRVVRIYTIHPPAFYDELARYNDEHPDAPLYLMQGVYFTDEEAFIEAGDLWDDRVLPAFLDEIADAQAAVHGRLERAEAMPGRATGTWSTDVSDHVAGWILGIELDPDAVVRNDATNADRPAADGRYVRATPEATATERGMAEAMDHLAALEAADGRSSPLAFVNWPTTDPLDHPDEPLQQEDLVAIDANHVLATEAWPGGVFASYHAYPYYPDFQRYEPGLQVPGPDGEIDPYRAYLRLLRQHHEAVGMPTLVTEFGVPSSVGSAHDGPRGRDQGGHTEAESLAIDADLLTIIAEEGLGGGFLFMLADEWFKFTWNTIDLQSPADRRALWFDTLTNEESFGLVANDPGRDADLVLGDDVGWGTSLDGDVTAPLDDLRAAHDEGYLYLRLGFEGAPPSPVVVGLDVDPDHDGGGLPGTDGLAPGADLAVVVDDDGGTVSVATGRDHVALLYGTARDYVDVAPGAIASGSGAWLPFRLLINRPYVVPSTGEVSGTEIQDLSALVEAPTDPDHDGFDAHGQLWRTGTEIQLRLPWSVLGLADPSSRAGLRIGADGETTTFVVDQVGIEVVAEDAVLATTSYAWEGWDVATWRPRLKAGVVDYTEVALALAAGERPDAGG